MKYRCGRMAAVMVSVAGLIVGGAIAAPAAQAADVLVGRSGTISVFENSPPAGSVAVTGIEVSQNVAQSTVTSKVTYAAAVPAADTTDIQIYFGKVSATDSCQASFAMAGRPGPRWSHAAFLPSTTVTSSIAVSGATATVTARGNARLGSTAWDCAYAVTVKDETSYQTSGWVRLRENTVEVPELSVGAPATVSAKGKKWVKVQISVYNSSRDPVQNVTVKLSGTKLKFKKKSIKIASLAGRKSVKRTVKVQLKGKKTRTISVKASAPGAINDAAKTKVLRYKKSTKLKTLRGQYFWGADSSLDDAWQPRGVHFVDSKRVYVGLRTKGLPKKACKPKKNCYRYKYNPRTGKVSFGKFSGTVDSKSLLVKEKGGSSKYYSRISFPKKGKKFKVSLHHQGANGCGYGYGKTCYTYTWYLTLGKNGKFSEGRQGTTSWGIPTDNWFVGGSNDEKGTYKVLSRGRVQLRYANGTKKTVTLGVFMDDREKASPRFEGILLGGTKYYS
ncbi:hypothetical protein SAMN06309944_1291 [Micrococcales bacterium KH10]|nr:hypothetical protein SAMN06309944_1291 [Micrococcales bacterium KH10]